MRFLLLPFIVLPIVEMFVLIEVGSRIGALPTIGLVLLTAVVGAALLRQQGLATLLRANERMHSGQIPAQEVGEGLILAVGGALLLTPGFVTDAVGLFCLLPGSRHWLVKRVLKRMTVAGQGGVFSAGFGPRGGFGPGSRPGGSEDSSIIEGEFDRDGEQGRESGDPHRSGARKPLPDSSSTDEKK